MGHKLRIVKFEDGRQLYEKACEHYRCKSCGCGMISCNFVNGVCIQVFVSHGDKCREYLGNAFARTREVACDTCAYYGGETSCQYDGALNEAMERVRTGS